jgi:ClpP class serine protease
VSIAEWAGGQPLAIDPSCLDSIAASMEGAESLSGKSGTRSESSRVLSVRDGVAEILVRGVISRYESFWSWLMGGTSTDSIAKALHSAVNDPEIKAIVLHVDSPGGQSTGIGELAGYIREASKSKPVASYVEGYGSSAAYWIASAAPEVILSPSATVGSIGTLVQLDTRSRPGELVIVSSQSPDKRPDLKTEAGKAKVQSWLDSLSAVFIADVAMYRGVSEKVVMSDFGKGGSLVGADAVKAGMADGLGDFEGVLKSMRDTGKAMPSKGVSPRRSAERGGKFDSRQGKPSMNPFNVLSKLWATNPEAVQDAMASETVATPAFESVFASLKAKPAPATKSEADIRAEIEAEFKAKFDAHAAATAKANLDAAAKEKASTWVASLGEKVTPAQANNLLSVYASLVVLDAESPLSRTESDGSTRPVSRASVFAEPYEALASHGMTQEIVSADKSGDAAKNLTKLGKVLPNADDADAGPTPEQRAADLLKMTDLGRKALKIQKSGE